MGVNELCSDVAEGGELCLTSGDRREPEDSDIYKKTLLLARLCRARRRGVGERVHFPRVPFSHPRLSIIRRLRRRHATHLLITINIIRSLTNHILYVHYTNNILHVHYTNIRSHASTILLHRNTLNLYERILWQRLYSHGRACRERLREELGVYLVHGSEVVHIA